MKVCFNAHCHANNDVDGAGPSGCIRVACGDILTTEYCFLSSIDTRAALAELPNTSTNTASLKLPNTAECINYLEKSYDGFFINSSREKVLIDRLLCYIGQLQA